MRRFFEFYNHATFFLFLNETYRTSGLKIIAKLVIREKDSLMYAYCRLTFNNLCEFHLLLSNLSLLV